MGRGTKLVLTNERIFMMRGPAGGKIHVEYYLDTIRVGQNMSYLTWRLTIKDGDTEDAYPAMPKPLLEFTSQIFDQFDSDN